MKGQNQRGIIFVLAIIMLASTVLCFSVFVRAEEKTSVVFRIEGDTECFYSGVEEIESGSSLKSLISGVNAKASLQILGIETDYITSIKGVSAGKYGGWDGWLYLVNGEMPVESIANIKLYDGDEVIFFYGDTFGAGFQFPELEFIDGKISFYSMDTEYDASYNPVIKKNAIVGASVSIFNASGKEYKYVTDENGFIDADASLLTEGKYTYKIEKYSSSGLPLLLRSEEDAHYVIEGSPETSDNSVILCAVVIAVISAASVSYCSKKRI